MLEEWFEDKVIKAGEAIENGGDDGLNLDADEVMAVIVELSHIIKMARKCHDT